MSVWKIKWLVFVASMWILNSIDDISADIVGPPADTEVRVGDSTYLNCSISTANGEVSWYHYPLGKEDIDLRYVYANKQMFEPYNRRFMIEKIPSTASFNLIITQVEVQDAGSYVCEDGRKSATSQLIVLESTPDCKSNINSSGFIGPNVCGLQKEAIQLSCAINYTGNIAPKLQWTRLKQDNWFTVPESSCSDFDGRITCNYTTEADTQLDESVFICHSNRSRNPKENCKTEAVKILYAFATDNQMEKTVGETVTCVANTNSICWSYTWFYSEGVQYSVISRSQSVSLENAGWYRCEANCSVKSQQCSYNTMTVNADTDPEFSHYNIAIALLSCCVVALIVTLLILFFYIRKRNRKPKEYKPVESISNYNRNHASESQKKEKQQWPVIDGRINPFNEHLLKCRAEPLIYDEQPKQMKEFTMKKDVKENKRIYGIAVLRDMLYALREDCNEIEVYSITNYNYKESIPVESLLCPYDIISHDAKNYLFIYDSKHEEAPNEIIRVTPNGKIDFRWYVTNKSKTHIEIGLMSLTPRDGNILIPLGIKNEMKLREYDCDGNLKRELNISLPLTKIKHFRQAILLRSGYFVLSFGDSGTREARGVFMAKKKGKVLKCILDDSNTKVPETIFVDTPSNEDIKNQTLDLKISLPSHTITLDDLSILVADRENSRVLLYYVETAIEAEPRLKFERVLLSRKNGLNKPYGLCLDRTTGCLFVADNEKLEVDGQKNEVKRRILVYSVI